MNKMEDCSVFIRLFLLTFNLISLMVGTIFVSVGAIMITQYNKYAQAIGPDLSTVPIFVMVIGTVIILLAIMGLLGVIRGNVCFLTCYSGLLSMLVIGEIAVCVTAYTGQKKMEATAHEQLLGSLSLYPLEEATKLGVDLFQRKFHCCGVRSFQDWEKVFGLAEVPTSCCIDTNNCQTKYNDTSNAKVYGIQPEGCLNVITRWIRANGLTVAFCLLATGVVQIAGILVGVVYAYNLKKSYTVI